MINSEQNRNQIIKAFPNLKSDPFFVIVDKANPNYNCIAWAGNVTDCWWDSIPIDKRPIIKLDGVKIDWPFGVRDEFSINTLIEIFTHLGYVICKDANYEEGFKKIAFYEKNGKVATHAARQLTSGKNKGVWSSKLGGSFLIHHGTPCSLESNVYGKAIVFMKKNMN